MREKYCGMEGGCMICDRLFCPGLLPAEPDPDQGDQNEIEEGDPDGRGGSEVHRGSGSNSC